MKVIREAQPVYLYGLTKCYAQNSQNKDVLDADWLSPPTRVLTVHKRTQRSLQMASSVTVLTTCLTALEHRFDLLHVHSIRSSAMTVKTGGTVAHCRAVPKPYLSVSHCLSTSSSTSSNSSFGLDPEVFFSTALRTSLSLMRSRYSCTFLSKLRKLEG